VLRYLLLPIRSRKLLLSLSLALFALFFIGLFANFIENAGSALLRFVVHPFAIFTLFILAVDLMLLSRITQAMPVREERKHVEKRMYAVFVGVSSLYVALVYAEILLWGHTLYAPILLVICMVFYTLVSEVYSVKEGLVLGYLPLLLAVLITAHYIVFSPSFGNDTWRDIMWCEETLRTGHFADSRITDIAYPVPLVVLLYSMISLIGGFTAADSSVVIGLLYLFILGIILLILLRRIHGGAESSILTILLLLIYSAPLITLWSVWFIPQSLALIFMTLLLMSSNLKHHSWAAQVILAIALVFSHPGVALYTLIYFAFLSLFTEKGGKWRKSLLLISTVYITYTVYTSVHYVIGTRMKLYLDHLLTIFLGREVSQVQVPTEMGLLSGSFPLIPVAVAFVLGIDALYANSLRQEKSNEWEVLTVLFSTITLAVSYVLTMIDPHTVASRYIGLQVTFLLIASSYSGIKVLRMRRLSKGFLYGLEALLISVLAFGGTFTPLNSMTLNPSSYSIYGLLTYADAKIIYGLVKITDPYSRLTIYTDWRTGEFYMHILLREYNVVDTNGSFSLCPAMLGNIELRLFGVCRNKYRGDLSFMHSDTALILRATSFTMIESWGMFKPEFSFKYSNDIDKVLDSGGIIIYVGR